MTNDLRHFLPFIKCASGGERDDLASLDHQEEMEVAISLSSRPVVLGALRWLIGSIHIVLGQEPC